MNVASRLINDKSLEYAEKVGYLQKQRFIECVAEGDLVHLDPLLEDYLSGLSAYVENDLIVAKDSIRYVWAQMNAYVTKEALSHTKARNIQAKYYYELELVTEVDKVYELCRAMSRELVEVISAENRINHYSLLVKKINIYVKNHLYDKLTVVGIADAMNFSQSWISHKFKEETGITLEQHIQKERISEAKKLLETHMSISDIASMLRFASQSHFTKIFRKQEGVTPKQYRKLI